MAKAVDDLVAAVAAKDTVDDSVMVYIAGVPKLVTDAVTAAMANGATAAELAPITAVIADLQARGTAMAAAIVANTPVGPVMTKGKKP